MDRVRGELSSIGSLSGTLSGNSTLTATLSLKVIETEAYDIYTGEHVVIPATEEQVLETANKLVKDDISVKEIPTFEVSNEFGTSFIIAS